jgi:hypothetical protein
MPPHTDETWVFAGPHSARLDDLLVAPRMKSQPSTTVSLARKSPKSLLGQEPTLTPNALRSVGHSIVTVTVPEADLRRNSAAASDCARHAWQAR